MLRLLLVAGAVYAAYRLGKEAGRSEAKVIPLPPPDHGRDKRRRSAVDVEPQS